MNRVYEAIEEAYDSDHPLLVTLHTGRRLKFRRITGLDGLPPALIITGRTFGGEHLTVALSEIADVRINLPN